MRAQLWFWVAVAATLVSCDVHEFPATPERVPLHIRLHYDTDMTTWEHRCVDGSVTELGIGDSYDNTQTAGCIRYIIRTYPTDGGTRTSTDYHAEEYTFTRNIAGGTGGYDTCVTLNLLPGSYELAVWTDLTESPGMDTYYNADVFNTIALQGEHAANTNWRDAFRGIEEISLAATTREQAPDTVDIAMERPLAKFEFVSDDVVDFIAKEIARGETARGEDGIDVDEASRIDLNDYSIVFYYNGYYPTVYSMFADKPVDSVTGETFYSSMTLLSGTQASLGFDYVFVNGTESKVSVRAFLFDKSGMQIGLTDAIPVPLKRNRHTIIHGTFLTAEGNSGIGIDPDFDGDFNITLP